MHRCPADPKAEFMMSLIVMSCIERCSKHSEAWKVCTSISGAVKTLLSVFLALRIAGARDLNSPVQNTFQP